MGYTCKEYREEMLLLSLKRQLEKENLSPREREDLRTRISLLEEAMGMAS